MINTIQPHLVVDLQKAALHQETAGAVASAGLCLSLNGVVEVEAWDPMFDTAKLYQVMNYKLSRT